MRRTQLYLDDSLWNVLHTRAEQRGVTLSELVREAVRERYLGKQDEQKKAMRAFVGSGSDRFTGVDTAEHVRDLRRSDRLERIHTR